MIRFAVKVSWVAILLGGISVSAETQSLITNSSQINRSERRTIFGLPYIQEVSGQKILSPQPQNSNSSLKPVGSLLVDPDQPQNNQQAFVPEKRKIDYSLALKAAPIDMIMANSLSIGGNTIRVNDGFSMDMPLSRFSPGEGRQTVTSSRPGQADATRITTNPEDNIMVKATFVLLQVRGDNLIFKVIPDPKYPAQQTQISMRMSAIDADSVLSK